MKKSIAPKKKCLCSLRFRYIKSPSEFRKTICSSSILLLFQLQVNLQNDLQQPDSGIDTSSLNNAADDDIDAALSELQLTLGGSIGHSKANDITHIPELTDYLRFLR